mmetsp:Transcript_14254/g.42374  ORF Transcript_14254/g.42374 Transcript_14254/m.42374 type:complete len:216 (-) Transcript_14254:1502-2149(-)
MRSSCPAIASRRWRLSSSSFACTPAKSSRAARSASTSCGSEAPLTPSQAARPPSPAPLEEPISMAAAGSAAAVMRARDHVPVQPSRKPNAMTSAPITHEKAATMSGTRIEPSAATIGPSASETTSSGRHMKRFIVAITLPAASGVRGPTLTRRDVAMNLVRAAERLRACKEGARAARVLSARRCTAVGRPGGADLEGARMPNWAGSRSASGWLPN